jgi:predicted homoserine dehydrogenase-like protein
MIGLNEELAEREAQGKPIRIGLIGAGRMGTDVVAETRMMKGVEVVATADIDPARADQYREWYNLYCEVYLTLKELLHRL